MSDAHLLTLALDPRVIQTLLLFWVTLSVLMLGLILAVPRARLLDTLVALWMWVSGAVALWCLAYIWK